MPDSDRNAVGRMAVQFLVGVLFGILAWNANGVTDKVGRLDDRLQQLSITVDGHRSHLNGLAKELERVDGNQRRIYDWVLELRHQKK